MRSLLTNLLRKWADALHQARIKELQEQIKKSEAAHVAKVNELQEEIDRAKAENRVAETENRLLSNAIEKHIAQQRRERAINDSERAAAVATIRGADEQGSG